MNADPALPVSKGNDAGHIQKINSGSFPNEIQGIYHLTALRNDKFENRHRDAVFRSSLSTVLSILKRVRPLIPEIFAIRSTRRVLR